MNRHRQLLTVSLLTLSLLASAHSDEKNQHPKADPHFVPLIALGGGTIGERTTLDLSEYTDTTDRSLWMMTFDLGLAYAMPSGFLRVGRLYGRSFLGAGFVFRPGDWPVRLLQELVWDFNIRRWFSLFFGLGMGAHLNASRFSRSALSFSIPLGIRLGWAELAFCPGYNISISKEERDVYKGEMIQRTATDFAPLFFYLRLRLPRLGW